MYLKNKLYRILTIVLFLCHVPFLGAQEYWFKKIGVSDGLSASQVNTICKDSRGFVWFGTSAGLNMYDGFYIRKYQSNYLNASSLSDNYITSIQEGYDGDLWIRTSGGYVILNPNTERFDRSISQRLSVIDANLTPDLIFFDHWKNVWVYVKDQALYYYKSKQQLVYTLRFGEDMQGMRKGTISDICEVTDGVLVAYTNGLVCCVSGEQQRVLWYNEVVARNTNHEEDYQVYGDTEGNIWLYGDAHSYYYDRSTTRWYQSLHDLLNAWEGTTDISNELVTGVATASDGKMWISTDRGGLLLIDPMEHKVITHIKEGGTRGLPSNQLRTLYMDDTELLWVGSFRSGACYYAPNLYLFDISNVGDVYGMDEDKAGGLWFATRGNGLVYRHPKEGTSMSYTTADGLNDNMLSCVVCGSDGTLWVGSNRFGLNRIKSGNVELMSASNNTEGELKDNDIQALAEDKYKNIWIATRKGGLHCYNPQKGKFSYFNVQNRKLMSNNVTSLCSRGDILVAGTTNGIMLLNLTSNESHIFMGTQSGDKHFSSNVITQVFIDSRGLIWVGTREGINVLDINSDQLVTFKTQDGLASDVICAIAEDKNHDIWLTTTKGVNRVTIQQGGGEESRHTFDFMSYSVSDGLQGIEFNMGAIMTTHDGRILMGGQNGVNWMRSFNYEERQRPLNVFLSRFIIGDQPIGVGENYGGNVFLPASLNSITKLHLLKRNKTISFTLGVDDYNHAEPARYMYQLEGRSDKWYPVSGDGHTLVLPPLPSGQYKLHVKALLDNGKTVSKEHVLELDVAEVWYTTWWFTLLMAVALIGVLYIIYRIYPLVKGYYRERRAEIEQLRKRQEELDNLTRDMRNHVVGMIPQLGLLQMEINDLGQKETLNGLQHKARQILNLMNRVKKDSSIMISDQGLDVGTTTENVLIGDDGLMIDDDTQPMDFLVSDEGIISTSTADATEETKVVRRVVYVVESDADMLEFVADCLKSTFQIRTFTTAESCKEGIIDKRPDIIMCAENLNGMSGSQFCQNLKSERAYERLPFILTTEGILSQAEFAAKNITLLADDYIPSPYNLQSVIVRINLLLGDPLGDNVIPDDTLRGAAAMQNAANEQLTTLLDQYIHQNISRRELSLEEMSQVLGVSRTVLFRKIESVTQMAPSEYMRMIRLQEAAKLLETGYVTPAEAATELGFGNLATFSRFFQDEYGVMPSEYAEGKRISDFIIS